MKTKLLLILLLFWFSSYSQCDYSTPIANINSLDHTQKSFVTQKIIDSIFSTLQSKISGATLKDGKFNVSSATLDEKGLTFNYGKIKVSDYSFLGVNASATSEDKLANIFSKDQSLTYSIGLNTNFFDGGVLTISDDYSNEGSDIQTKIQPMVKLATYKTKLDFIQNNLNDYISYLQDITSLNSIELRKALQVERYLKDLNIKISKEKLAAPSTINITNDIKCKLEEIKLKEADSIQFNAKFKKSLKWLNIGAKYNNTLVSIIDLNIEDLKRNKVNDYLSCQLSGNAFWSSATGNNNKYLSLVLSYKNPRNYKEADKKTINIETVNNSYVAVVTDPPTVSNAYDIKTVTGFEKTADRVNVFALELPFTYFHKKSNTGLDLSIKAGVNDPNDDNVSARIGVFFPLSKTGTEVVTIEPLFKIQKLFNTSSQVFFKDNVVFGFNLSFAVPKFF